VTRNTGFNEDEFSRGLASFGKRPSSRFSAAQSLSNLVKRSIDFFAFDYQWWRDANHVVMRFFAEDSFLFQPLAIRASEAVELDTDPQSFATDFFQIETAQSLQKANEVCAEFRRTLD
jgi:hypothetical protein